MVSIGGGSWTRDERRARTFVDVAFLATVLAWLAVNVVRRGVFAADFHYAFWQAGRHVLDGTSPFPHVIDLDRLPFIYPAPAALLFAPFATLPRPLAEVVFTAVLATALVFALRLCRVRDPRCYLLAFLWAPVFSALQTANVTLLLALGLAAVIRLERRPLAAAAVAAVLISLKVFLWPVAVWLGVRRGMGTGLATVALALVVTLASWWIIGFAGFREYADLMQLVSRVQGPRSYSFAALGMRFGASQTVATTLAVAVGVLLLVAVVYVARRENGDGRQSFALLIGAVILCSPVVWLHYFALLVVALALLSPRLGPAWFAPLLLWPCPVMLLGPSLWPLAPPACLALAIVAHRISGGAAPIGSWTASRAVPPASRFQSS